MPLSDFVTQHMALVKWAVGTRFKQHRHFGGEEVFVLDAVFQDEHASYPTGSSIRSPHWSSQQAFSDQGCILLVKTGHLPIGEEKE